MKSYLGSSVSIHKIRDKKGNMYSKYEIERKLTKEERYNVYNLALHYLEPAPIKEIKKYISFLNYTFPNQYLREEEFEFFINSFAKKLAHFPIDVIDYAMTVINYEKMPSGGEVANICEGLVYERVRLKHTFAPYEELIKWA